VSRIETAVRISAETWPERRYDAYLARADLFPDALVTSFLAGFYNGGGPLLLTPTGELHVAVRQELQRLQTQRVFIIGSFAAIAPEVEAEIREMGIETARTFGRDRYETARSVAATAPESYGTAFVATGTDFADALAAGPLAYALRRPTFLTTPDELHPAAAEALHERAIHEVVIVGGAGAVSERVARQIERICPEWCPEWCIETRRIGGRNRTETAALLADEFAEGTGHPITHVNLARGDDFPDAAAGGPHGGQELAPILLSTGRHARVGHHRVAAGQRRHHRDHPRLRHPQRPQRRRPGTGAPGSHIEVEPPTRHRELTWRTGSRCTSGTGRAPGRSETLAATRPAGSGRLDSTTGLRAAVRVGLTPRCP
jgi:putative cell wall-binding protein